MTLRLLATISLAAAALCGGCKKRKATVQPDPLDAGEEQQQPPAPPQDSLYTIGMEAAGLVQLWVYALGEVQTEDDVEATIERLGKLGDQFGYLLERADKLPALSQDEFKRVDDEIDPLIRTAAAGLDPETQRIFLLPDPIKSKVLPANQKLMEQFRDMSRAIRDSHSKADDDAAE